MLAEVPTSETSLSRPSNLYRSRLWHSFWRWPVTNVCSLLSLFFPLKRKKNWAKLHIPLYLGKGIKSVAMFQNQFSFSGWQIHSLSPLVLSTVLSKAGNISISGALGPTVSYLLLWLSYSCAVLHWPPGNTCSLPSSFLAGSDSWLYLYLQLSSSGFFSCLPF